MEAVDKMVYETLGFEPIVTPTTKHVVTTGRFKGWTMNTSLVLKRAIFRGVSQDGTPIIDVTYQIISTPTRPDER